MYIQYTLDQLYLLMDLEEDIPHNHLVRVVNTAVNQLDDSIFDAVYSGGGRGVWRFLLRGLHKVSLEVGWLSLSHNLLKQAQWTKSTK